MIADPLLDRLKRVKKTGRNRWIAECPTHKSKSGASLAITVSDSDKLLLHDFGGCAVAEIVEAVGLNLADLFPPQFPGVHSAHPRASSLTPLVGQFENDLLVVHVLLADIAKGKPIGDRDRVVAKAASGRIWNALREARHAI